MMFTATRRIGLDMPTFWDLELAEFLEMVELCSKYENEMQATQAVMTGMAMNGKNPFNLLKDKPKPVMIGEASNVHKPNNAAAFMF